MRIGQRLGYWIIEWAGNFDPTLWDFLPHFPELVMGNRIAITSFDSGPFTPTQTDCAKGWCTQEGVAISPVIDNVEHLPAVGFDEWYVFSGHLSHIPLRSFVNRWGFAPLNDEDEGFEAFWEQVERCQPLHVIGAGTPSMFLVTKDRMIFERISAASPALIDLSRP